MRSFLKKIGYTMILCALCLSMCSCLLLPQEEEALAPPLVTPAPVEFNTEEVELTTLENTIEVTGTFASSSYEILSFPISGYVAEVNFRKGDEVKAGDIIAQMDTSSLQFSLEKAQVQLKYARRALNDAGGENSQLQEAVELGKLEVANLEEQIARCQIVASMDGKISSVSDTLIVGNSVAPNQEMVRIQEIGELELRYEGPDAKRFSPGTKVTVDYNGSEYSGSILTSPENATENEDGTIPEILIVQVDDLDYLNVGEGDRADITAVTERKENVVALPKSYINSFVTRTFVYVLDDGVRTERDVKLGMETTNYYEISEGLEPGDLVIKP